MKRTAALIALFTLNGCAGTPSTPQPPPPPTAAPVEAPPTPVDPAVVALANGKIEPTLDASAAGTDAGFVPIANADVVVASLRKKFRSCYNAALAKDASEQGKVVLSTMVDATGAVESVVPSWKVGLSDEAVQCFGNVVKDAHFAPPGGKGATLNIPITFVTK